MKSSSFNSITEEYSIKEEYSRDNSRQSRFGRIKFLPRFSDLSQRRFGRYIVNFLVGFLILTLIVRGTSAAALARVETANPVRAEIIEAVSGKASVSVCSTLDITVPEGLKIKEIFVGQGQKVSVGDAIAGFDIDEIQEKLARETGNLDKMLLDLEKLERGESADSSVLESARRSLLRTREDYDIVKEQGDTDVGSARKTLEEIVAKQEQIPDTAAIDTAQRNLERTREDYNAAAVQGNADIVTAQDELDDAIKKQFESADSGALDTANLNLSRAREDYNNIKTQSDKELADALTAYQNAQSIANIKHDEWDNADDEDKPAAHQIYLEAQSEAERALSAYETAREGAQESLKSAGRRIEDATIAVNKAEQDYYKGSQQAADSRQAEIDKARDALEAVRKRLDENLISAARRVEDAEIALQNAQQDFTKNSDKASQTLQDEIDKAQEAYESAQKRANENLLNAARRVEDAGISLAKAEQDYDKSIRQTDDTAAQNKINAVALQLDIEKQKSIVDALGVIMSAGGVLYSDIGGVVSSVKPEGSATNQDALVAFMDGARGFEANMQLDKSDAEKLIVGEACEVTTGGGSMYFTPTVTGVVAAISMPDDQDKVQITIRLPAGDWSEGQRVDVQTVQDRSVYDLCVPKSALHSDNTGYYLLVIEQTSSVLGIENTALKVYVNISASDDDMAAVEGAIDRNGRIVTGSNKPVSAGDRIRMNSK